MSIINNFGYGLENLKYISRILINFPVIKGQLLSLIITVKSQRECTNYNEKVIIRQDNRFY